MKGDTTHLEQSLFDAERMGKRFSSNLLTAFDAVAFKGKSLGDTFKSLALSMSNMVVKAAFAPLQQGIANSMTGLFKGMLPFANGGVLRSGTPVPFAQGGVISSPVTFPLPGGRTGLAGEAGAEAIMPLARGPDGRLGVVAQGGGGGGPHITINISTPDVESFNRSQTQVAAMIARAATLGQRNL
ncbi:MAG: phage tail tape measure protein [Hyphomicrobium sp.]|nr:phage tail tape measure protein [Hyphomicrobium sp.]